MLAKKKKKNVIITVGKYAHKKGKMTARLIKAVTEPMDINIKCTLTGTAKERDTLGDGYIDPDKTGGTLMAYSNDTAFWKHNTNITKVVFENTLTPHETSEELIYDVSVAQDGSVMSYLVPNEEDTTKYTLYINSDEKVVANEDSSDLFFGFSNLQEIEHLEYLDTSNVTVSFYMFKDMSETAVVKVRDEITQDWILALSSDSRPETWTTANVIIKEA